MLTPENWVNALSVRFTERRSGEDAMLAPTHWTSLLFVRAVRSRTLTVALVRQAFHLAIQVFHRAVQFAQLSLKLFKAFVGPPGLAPGTRTASIFNEALLAFPGHALGEVGQARRPELLDGFAQVLLPLVRAVTGTGAVLAHLLGPAFSAF